MHKPEIQPYMISHGFNNQEVTMLIALRSNTVKNIKINFSSWCKTDLSFSLKCQQIQQNQKEYSQRHLLSCQTLLTQLTWEQHKLIQGINYDDLHSRGKYGVRRNLVVTLNVQ